MAAEFETLAFTFKFAKFSVANLHIVQIGFLDFRSLILETKHSGKKRSQLIVPFSFSRRCLNVFLVEWPLKLKSLSLLMAPF